eukprot:scaffold2117_cov241-Pinguiococcus_pyrenoidosus.AAC.18
MRGAQLLQLAKGGNMSMMLRVFDQEETPPEEWTKALRSLQSSPMHSERRLHTSLASLSRSSKLS